MAPNSLGDTKPPQCDAATAVLARVPGVVAIVLGGSWARGAADTSSDVDLGIYYERDDAPSIDALREAARAVDPQAELADYGEWGPWVNGGGWLTIEERAVDWLYRDLALLREAMTDCLAGRVSCHYTLAHPHGFHNSYYLAELHHCVPLYDPRAVITRLRQEIDPYPSVLRQSILEKYLYEAGFTLHSIEKNLPRADVVHATGSLFRTAAALVQVIFALNERWLMNEKRAIEQIVNGGFALVPSEFGARVEALLANVGGDEAALRKSLQAMQELTQETRALAPPLRYEWK